MGRAHHLWGSLLKTHEPSLIHEGEIRQLPLRSRGSRSRAEGAVRVPRGVLGQRRTLLGKPRTPEPESGVYWREQRWILSCGRCPPANGEEAGQRVPVLAVQLISKSKTNLKFCFREVQVSTSLAFLLPPPSYLFFYSIYPNLSLICFTGFITVLPC